jgi:predicted dehydrogenase
MKKLGIGIIGCGNVAGGHIRGWLQQRGRARIAALCDLVPQFCEERRAHFNLGKVAVCTDYRKLLAMRSVQAVDICSQSDTHSEIIRASLEAGKHVLTEKPVGYDLEDCRLLRWYAKKYSHLKMAVAYSLRYYPVNLAVRDLLTQGVIGRPIYAQAVHNHPHDLSRIFDRPHGPHAESDKGGRYIHGSDLTPTTHVFDLCRYLLGEVKEVFAFREPYGTFVMMRFTSGALAQAISGTASKFGVAAPNVLTIQGTEGVLVTFSEPRDPRGLLGRDARGESLPEVSLPRQAPAGQERRSLPGPADPRYRGYYQNESGYHEIEVTTYDNSHGDLTRCQNFLDAVFDDVPLIAPLEDAIRTSELLHAIRDSHDHEIRVPIHWRTKTG